MISKKYKTIVQVASLCLTFALSFTRVSAQKQDTFKVLKSIPLTIESRWDYLTMDPASHHLYISGTTANKVIVVDVVSEKIIGEIPNTRGVHGIALAPKYNKGFTSNGRTNSVTVFDIQTLKVLDTIALNAKGPDAIMYDPFTDRVFVFNGHSDNAVVIDAKTNKVLGAIDLGGGPEFGVSDGKGHVYVNLEDKSEVVSINASTMKAEAHWSLNPGKTPTGLAMDTKNGRLFSVCRENKGMSIVSTADGKVVATVPIGTGTDAAAYDADNHLVFSSNGDGTLTIIAQSGADGYKVQQVLMTQKGSKTMAYDPATHKIYLAAAEFGTDRKVTAGSFKLLVVGK
jgi:YVTN family beta-propeller protein